MADCHNKNIVRVNIETYERILIDTCYDSGHRAEKEQTYD